MTYLAWLVPIALGMGIAGLMAFMWSMRSGQYEDLDGAAERVLLADASDAPMIQVRRNGDVAKQDSSNDKNAPATNGIFRSSRMQGADDDEGR